MFHKACNFIQKETLTQVLSFEFCEFLKTPFLTEHLRWLLLILFYFLAICFGQQKYVLKMQKNMSCLLGQTCFLCQVLLFILIYLSLSKMLFPLFRTIPIWKGVFETLCRVLNVCLLSLKCLCDSMVFGFFMCILTLMLVGILDFANVIF